MNSYSSTGHFHLFSTCRTPKRDGQVEAAAFLGDVRGAEVHRDPASRGRGARRSGARRAPCPGSPATAAAGRPAMVKVGRPPATWTSTRVR